MKIAYAGPRPSISHTGIAFESYRPDKFIYFQDVYHLFLLIDNASAQQAPLIYKKPLSETSVKQIQSWVHKHHREIETVVTEEMERYQERLKHKEQVVLDNASLNQDEKKIFQTNLQLMHKYRLQRATNKILYWYMIDAICDSIIQKGINEFVFPFEPKLYHIVEAIANHITSKRLPLRPNIVLKENRNDKVLIYLILEKV